jgi:hypothetical protein
MAMSCTITEEQMSHIKKVKFAWVSGSDGKASGTTTGIYSGEIIRLVTIPGATTLAPTDNYDVVVTDGDGADVLMGAGADRDTAATEQVLASSLGCVANDTLSLAITNAGSGKGGTVILYIK